MARGLPELRARLAEYYEPHEIDIWMTSPHPQLGGACAADGCETPGGVEECHVIIDRLDSGAFL